MEKYIKENLNDEENSTIQMLKKARYYPFIKERALCKLWEVYKNQKPLYYYGAKTIEIAKILIDGEVENYQTLLVSAIRNKNIELVQFLIDKGADINHYDQCYGRLINLICSYPDILGLLLAKINFLSLVKAFIFCESNQFGRIIFREIVYRMRYILLAAVIIPAIYVAAVGF